MKKRRNWLKTTIAMFTLIATVLETGFSSVPAYAAALANEDSIEAAALSDGEALTEVGTSEEDISAEEITNPGDSEGADIIDESGEPEEGSGDITDISEAPAEEPGDAGTGAETPANGKIEVSESGISGSGYDEISIYIDTANLANTDKFNVKFIGSESASYNPVLNDELDRTNGGRYDFVNLAGGEFRIRATAADNVILSYKYNDNYPTIVAESKPADKVLTTKTLTTVDDSRISAVTGEGFESVAVKFDAEDLSDKTNFRFVVETAAAATVDGKDATKGIGGLDKKAGSVTVEDLGGEKFVAYAVSDAEDIKLTTFASVDSVKDGIAVITIDNVDTKREYEYEDGRIKVTATLEKADAIPDDAYFNVEPVEDIGHLLDLLNEQNTDEDYVYTEENTFFYDISFYADETKAEKLEPEEGAVRVSIDFKDNQLENELDATKDDNDSIKLIHFEEKGNTCVPKVVDANVSVENETAEFVVNNFSEFGVNRSSSAIQPGTTRTYREILGSAVNYGLTANELDKGGHFDSNFAAGTFKGANDTTQGAFTGGNVAGNNIIAKYDTSKGSNWYPYSSKNDAPFKVITTPEAGDIFRNNQNWRSYVRIEDNHTYEDLKLRVSQMVSGTLSNALKNEATQNSIQDVVVAGSDNGAPYTIDISDAKVYPAGTYYVNVPGDKYSKYFPDGNDTTIKIRDDQLIVFNISGTNVKLNAFYIDIAGLGKEYSTKDDADAGVYCEHVVWNMYEATTATNGNGVLGILLAPKADYTVGTTSSGWLVANKITNNGEWHFTWPELPPDDTTSGFEFDLTKYLVYADDDDNDDNDVTVLPEEWPANGFTFKIRKYLVDDPEECGLNNHAEKDASKIPDLAAKDGSITLKYDDKGAYWEFRLTKDNPTITFKNAAAMSAKWVYDNGLTYDWDTHYMVFMYKIEEINDGAANIIYGNEHPRFVKIFMNVDKKWDKYVFCDPEIKSHWTVKQAGCVGEFPNFRNKYRKPIEVPVTLFGYKEVKSSKTENEISLPVPNGAFQFSLYNYTRGGAFETTAAQTKSNVTAADGSSTVTFDPINLKFYRDNNGGPTGYNKSNTEGYYYFKIKETNCPTGYEMDPRVYVAKATVYKDGSPASVEYFEYSKESALKVGNGATIDDVLAKGRSIGRGFPFNFVNKRSATGSAVINGFKKLGGRDIEPTDIFEFELSSPDDDQTAASQTKRFSAPEVTKKGFAFAFDKLDYDLEDIDKTYHYYVKETWCNDSHVTIDTNEYTVVITVTDNGSKDLTVAQDSGTADEPLVFNNYYSASGTVYFEAFKKYVSGSILEANRKFSFILEGGKVGETPTAQIKSREGKGKVTFDTISFADIDSVGTYKYTIREDIPKEAEALPDDPTSTLTNRKIYKGVIYDARIYYVTVKVYDNKSGTLQKDVYGAYDKEPEETDAYKVDYVGGEPVVCPEFVNDYKLIEVSEPIGGDKILHGKDLERGEYTFTIGAYDTFTDSAITAGNVKLPATSVQNGVPESLGVKEFKFDSITFRRKGTYKFLIEESVTDPEPNTVYSTDKYVTTIVVEDMGGELEVTSKVISKVGAKGTVNNISFINTHYNPGDIPMFAYKDLSGRPLQPNQFTFFLRDANDPKAEPLQTKKNNASGEVAFDPIHFEYKNLSLDKDGKQEFKYIIEEDIPDNAEDQGDGTWKLNGYTYDGHKEYVTVTVTAELDTEGRRTGNLIVKSDNAVKAAHSVDGTDKDVWFRNKYEAEGSVVIDGTKKITGRKFKKEDSGLLVAELYEVINGVESVDPIQTADIVKSSNPLDQYGGEFKFEPIKYTEIGTYYYRVKEAGKIPGVINTTKVYDVEVEVTDNEDGTLNAVPTYKPGAICFINTFDAKNSVSFEAQKKVNGTELAGKRFSFELRDENGDLIESVENDDGGNIKFSEITYVQNEQRQDVDKGVFTYTIKEDITDTREGWTLAEEEYTVKVFLSLNKDGSINVDDHYYKKGENGDLIEVSATDIEFTNTYNAEGEVNLLAYKRLDGRDMKEGQFTFQLKDEKGNVVRTASNVAASAGEVAPAVFPEIKYYEKDLTAKDTHKVDDDEYIKYYTINEVIPDGSEDLGNGLWKKDGYTYDGSVYRVIVTLKDTGKGRIKTDWIAFKSDEVKPGEDNWFVAAWKWVKELFGAVNEYQYPLFVNVYEAEGHIDLSAKKILTGMTLKKGDFNFVLKEGKKVLGEISNGNKDDLNIAVFDRITYTEKGEHTYTINEVLPDGATAENNYTVEGVHYDNTVYTVIVKVTDPGTGKLDVKAYLTADGEPYATSVEVEEEDRKISLCAPEAFEFTNTYVPTEISVVPGGFKTLTGRDLEDGDFRFTLASKEGNPKKIAETVENKGEEFKFSPIVFKPEDMLEKDVYAARKTFEYTLKEEVIVPGEQEDGSDASEDSDGGIVYDTHEYDIVVTVVNEKGELKASITSDGRDIENVDGWYALARFYNTYKAKGTEDFWVRKTVKGTNRTDKEFTFVLTDETTGDKYTTTCTGDGVPKKIAEFAYDIADLDKKLDDGTKYKDYTYNCVEMPAVDENGQPIDDGYAYSKAVYTAVVHVEDNKDGTLKVEKTVTVTDDGNTVAYTDRDMEFVNTYSAFGEIDIPGSKLLSGRDLEDGEFWFVLDKKADDGSYVRVDRTSNKGDSFGFHLEYTEKDAAKLPYIYRVRELDPNDPADAEELKEILGNAKFEEYKVKNSDVIYDDSVYDVAVTVTDLNNGQLDVKKAITKDNQPIAANGGCSFTNKVVKPDSASFEAEKSLEGLALESDMFTFVLEGDGKDENKVKRTVTNKGEKVDFGSIQYKLSDAGKTFHYTIRELGVRDLEKLGLPAPAGKITFDEVIRTAEVKVSLVKVSEKESALKVERKYFDGDGSEITGIKFENKFEAETSVQFSGSKIVNAPEDAKSLLGYSYTFELAGIGNSESQTKTVTPDVIGKPVEYSFDPITYDQDDYINSAPDHKFTYRVKEVVPTLEKDKAPNVIYATNEYDVTVELYYDENMNLQTRKSDNYNKLDFINTYAAEGDVPFDGIKTITGKELENGAYTFTLKGEGIDQAIERTTSNANELFAFETVHYDESDVGDHYFTITETAKTADGSIYDSSEYKVKVTVFVNEQGKLDWKKQTTKVKNGETFILGDEEPIRFDNTYAAYGQHPLKVKKIMHNKPLMGNDFTFVLKDEAGNVIKKAVNTKASLKSIKDLTAVSEFEFEPLEFTQEDLKGPDGKSYLKEITKYYTIEEVNDSKKGYIYDDSVYAVALTIKPTEELNADGTYKLAITENIVRTKGSKGQEEEGFIKKLFKNLTGGNGNTVDRIVFDNDYDAECIVDTPILTKEVMGRNIERGMFMFHIDCDDGLESMGEKQKGYHRDVANGYTVSGKETKDPGEISVDDLKYKFNDLIFSEDDINLETGEVRHTFVYTATEDQKVTVPGIKNSPAVFTLTVTVYDIGDGVLHTVPPTVEEMKWVQITPNALTAEEYNDRFINTEDFKGSIDLIGIKKLNGRQLTKDDIFEFTLTDDESGRSVTVTNTDDGSGVPSVIAFKAEDVDFLNYKQGAFETYEGSDEYVYYTQEGEHTYTLVENYSDKAGIICDKSVFKITVEAKKLCDENGRPILDKHNHGILETKVTNVDKVVSEYNKVKFEFANNSVFEFTNEFKAAGKFEINGIKYLTNADDKEDMTDKFGFALYQYNDAARTTGKTVVDSQKTDKDGRFVLTAAEFDQEVLKNEKGEYETSKTLNYRIVETKPSEGQWTNNNTVFESNGIVYDNTEYNVDVTVTYDGTNVLKVDKVIKNAATGEVVTNIGFTNVKSIEYTTIEAKKHWVHNGELLTGNKLTTVPDITFNLYSSAVGGGKEIINTGILKAPETVYKFVTDKAGKELPKYDSNGNLIVYNVEEVPVPGYLSEKRGFDFYNTDGDIKIQKLDADTDEPLEGATLAIYDGQKEIDKWTSGSSAHVVAREVGLTAGKTYTLRELKAPEGYEIAADISFTVPSDGSDITVTMKDTPIIGSVRLTKRDSATRNTLAGAEFALYDNDGTRIYATGSTGKYRATSATSNGVFVTDSTGVLEISDLPFGAYYFVETKAPAGYSLSSEKLGFTIADSGKTVEVTYLNKESLGSVKLRKVSASGSRALEGAVFELYSATPRSAAQAVSSTIFSNAYYRYGTYTTNSSGEIYVNDLPWDDYYFVEVKAPEGFEIATDLTGDPLVYTFRIDESSAGTTIDLGEIVNNPEDSGVLGERRPPEEKASGVLGVRSTPKKGVLGTRVGPVTGDLSAIALWAAVMLACIGTIVWLLIDRKRRAAR